MIMVLIDHHTGRPAPLRLLPAGPKPIATVGNGPAPCIVTLSGANGAPEAVIYTRPAASTQHSPSPAAPFVAVRELTAAAEHPKALSGTKAFLEVAHFEADMHIVDVYA